MAVLNIDNRPFCDHGTHTCSGRFCSAFVPSKPHPFVAEMVTYDDQDESGEFCVCGAHRTAAVHKAG